MHTHTLYTHVDCTGQDVLCMYIYVCHIHTLYPEIGYVHYVSYISYNVGQTMS